MEREWSFERLLAAGRAPPRLFPLGADALELMSAHLARVAERARADGRRREAALKKSVELGAPARYVVSSASIAAAIMVGCC